MHFFEGEIQRKKYLVYGHDLHHDDTDTDHSGAAVHHLQKNSASSERIFLLILPHFFGQAFFIYQMMQFGSGIPRDLDEAAIIDGYGKYTIFTKDIPAAFKAIHRNHDHHSVLLEMGRFHVTNDLFEQAEDVHRLRGD